MNWESCEVPKKLLENRGHRLGIDQVMRHERGNFLQAHPLLDCPFPCAQGRCGTGFPPVRQPGARGGCQDDRCRRPARGCLLEIHQDLDGRQNILVCQNAGFPSFSFRSRRWLSL